MAATVMVCKHFKVSNSIQCQYSYKSLQQIAWYSLRVAASSPKSIKRRNTGLLELAGSLLIRSE